MAWLLLGMFLVLLLSSIILGTNAPLLHDHMTLPQRSNPSPGSADPPGLGIFFCSSTFSLLQPCYSEKPVECKVGQTRSQAQAETPVRSCRSWRSCASPRCPGEGGWAPEALLEVLLERKPGLEAHTQCSVFTR